MSDKDPSLRLNMGKGRKLELTHENTTLYTFLGKTALNDIEFDNTALNHVFIRLRDDKEGNPRGMYVFERFHPAYKDIASFAIEHSFTAVLNQRQIAECDLKAYGGQTQRQVEDFSAVLDGVMPEDFR